jgi:acyl-CoA synthetase (AMP-forming)/AMP-acid ligase II
MGRGRAEGAARSAETGLTALFHELLLEGATSRGAKAALVDAETGRAVRFDELPAAVAGVARRLRALGVRDGSVVALLGRNVPEYPLLVCGILAAGGAVTPVNPYFHPHEISAQLAATRTGLLVADVSLAEAARTAAADSAVGRIAVFDGSLELAEIALAARRGAEPREGAESGDALLAWSVGPGGLPAPARHTHASLSAALLGLAAVAPWSQDDVVYSAISPYDLYGLVATLALALRFGATAVTAARFDVPSFARIAREQRVTLSNVVPTIVRALSAPPQDVGGFGPLRLLISGGAPLAPHVARACAARTGAAVVQGYGLAEGAGATHVDAPIGEARVTSCGRPVAGLATRIAGPEGGALPPGTVGELWLRGEQVFRGYRGAEAKTDAALPADGWLRTGDLAFEDASRRLTVVGRRKPIVKVRGFQVSPAEIEAALREHPAVRDAVVSAEWDAVTGEESAAASVVAARDVTSSELAEWLASRVARHKRPASITLVSELRPRGDLFYPWAAPATS